MTRLPQSRPTDQPQPLGKGEVHPLVPYMGPVIEERLLEKCDVFLKPKPKPEPKPTAPPMLLVNCNNTPSWNGKTWATWLTGELDAGYAAGIRAYLLNGVYDGTPGIDETLPDGRAQAFYDLLANWAKAHPDTRIGLYARPNGQPAEWAKGVMQPSRDGTRPIMRVVETWAEVLGGYDRLIFALDASTRHGELTEDFADELAKLGVWFIGEGHGDYSAPYATIAIERYGWNKHGTDLPDVSDHAAPRLLWLSRNKIPGTGKTVAETMGITDAQLVAQYAAQGYAIVGSIESVAAWKAAKDQVDSVEGPK